MKKNFFMKKNNDMLWAKNIERVIAVQKIDSVIKMQYFCDLFSFFGL